MLSQLLDDHYKVQEQLQMRRSTRRPLSCDTVIRECLKWNQEYPDVKVEFKILFPKNFKAKGIKPMGDMCFIRELAQNQENPLQYPKVTSEQIEVFMQEKQYTDRKRAAWRLEEELYEKELDVVCDTLMKKLLKWNRNSATEKIKFWIQTPLCWTHPDIRDTNGKYVQVVDLSERKLSAEELERQFHIRFNTRIRDLDFQEFAIQSEIDSDGNMVPDKELWEVYDSMFGRALYMEPQGRIRTRFMFAHTKNLSKSPEEYKFDKSGEQLVMKSPKELESMIIRCEKEIAFRDRYMHLYYLEQQTLHSHPMAPAFKINSIALKFLRQKYMEMFGELFFPEKRYERFLLEGSPNIKPHERPTKVTCLILSEFDNRKFKISRNIGNFEIFPVIPELTGNSINGNSIRLENRPFKYSSENLLHVSHITEPNDAADGTSDVRSSDKILNFDKTARPKETVTEANNAEYGVKSEKHIPKRYKTRSLEMWKETKQRKLVVISKRRYSVKRKKNMKKIIVDQGKTVGLCKEDSLKNKYNVTNRSRGVFKDTHLCKGRRSVSHESVFDHHGQYQHSKGHLMYPFPHKTQDDTILAQAKNTTGCIESSEVFEQAIDFPDDEVVMNDELVTSKNKPDATIKGVTDSNNEAEGIVKRKELKFTPEFRSTSVYTGDEEEIENYQNKASEKTITKKKHKKPTSSSSLKNVSALQIPNASAEHHKNTSCTCSLQNTREPVPKQKLKNMAFDIFDAPKKPRPKPKFSSDKQSPSAYYDKVNTNEKVTTPNVGLNQVEELGAAKFIPKSKAHDIFDEPKKPTSKLKFSSDKKSPSAYNDKVNTNEKVTTPNDGFNQAEELSAAKVIPKSTAFDIFDEPKKPRPKPELSSASTSSSGTKYLIEKPETHDQTKAAYSDEINHDELCREKDDENVKMEYERQIRGRTRWPSRLSPINEQGSGKIYWPEKNLKQTTLGRTAHRFRSRNTPRTYKYSRLHNTTNNQCRIPVCLRQDQSTNRYHIETKNLNVVKSKFRYSRLHRMSQVATLLPDLWTKSEEMMMKLENRNTTRKQSNHSRVRRSPSRLGRPKHRAIPAKKRNRSMIPLRVKTGNGPKDNKKSRHEIEKYRTSKIPVGIKGYIWSSSETGEGKERTNMCKVKPGLRKSRIPIPNNSNKIIKKDGTEGHCAEIKFEDGNNKMPFRLPPIVSKSKPSDLKSPTKLRVSPVHLPPLPKFPEVSFRRSPPLLGKIPSTTSRPASVTGYCVLPPIGKGHDEKRPLSAGANRKFLPPIEQVLCRPLSASGYVKLPPIPRSE